MPTKHTIAQAKYDKANRRVYNIRLHNTIDADIINKLASVDSMQGYIKQLIRADIARTNTEKTKKEDSTMKRIYGSSTTHLKLSGKALEFYNLTDPISIEETEHEDGEYSYEVYSGKQKMHDGSMTEEQLVKWLEDGLDEYNNV